MSNKYPSIDKPWLKYYKKTDLFSEVPECTLYQYVYERNRQYLKDTAFSYYGKRISYKVFFEMVSRTAAALKAYGVKPGDVVTIMSMHTPETIYTIFALNYMGAVANMVYANLTADELIETVRETKSKLLMVLDYTLPTVIECKDKIKVPIVVMKISDSMPIHIRMLYNLRQKSNQVDYIKWDSFLSCGKVIPQMATDTYASAVIVYTSGTTGEPKGVELTNYNIIALAFQYKAVFPDVEYGDSFLLMIPPFFGFGIGTMAIAMGLGMSVTLLIDLEPANVAHAIGRIKPHYLMIGVAFIDAIIKKDYKSLSFFKAFGGGGGALSLEKEKEINEYLSKRGFDQKYLQGYGMTEAVATVCVSQKNAYKEGSVGVPLPLVNLKVLDESGEQCRLNETGEIWVNAPNVMNGYYNNQLATDEVIKDVDGAKWLKTGDLGYVDEDGFLFIQGRIKRISYTRMADGTVMRLFLQRIEEFVEGIDSVERCGVITKEDSERINIPVAFITLSDSADKNFAVEIVTNECKDKLPAHLRPSYIYVLDKIPLTASGKIDYRKLESL